MTRGIRMSVPASTVYVSIDFSIMDEPVSSARIVHVPRPAASEPSPASAIGVLLSGQPHLAERSYTISHGRGIDRGGEEPMNGTVQGVFHPVVSVSDMRAAVRYYRDLLGLSVTFDDYHDPAAISRALRLRRPTAPCRHRGPVPTAARSSWSSSSHRADARSWSGSRPMPASCRSTCGSSGIEAIVERLADAGYRATFRHRRPGPARRRRHQGRRSAAAPDGVTLILVELPEGRSSLGT